MLNVNLCPNFYLTPPSGYPVRLWIGGELTISAFLPKRIESVSADVYCESGSADVHMAIFSPPTTSNGDDQALVQQEDIEGLTNVPQTLTLTLPTDVALSTYVLRLWVDGLDSTRGVQVTKIKAE